MKNLKLRNKEIELTKRELQLERVEQVEETDNREITFSVSSEVAYERYDYFEVLMHSEEAIDLTRFKTKANILFNHDWDKVVGVITDAYIENAKLYVKAKFSTSKSGNEVYEDIKNGILSNVSIGYQILEHKVENRDGSQYLIATKWLPYEASIVSVPADITVGINRSAEVDDTTEETKQEDLSVDNEVNEDNKSSEQEATASDGKKEETSESTTIDNEEKNCESADESKSANNTEEEDANDSDSATTDAMSERNLAKKDVRIEFSKTEKEKENKMKKLGLTNAEKARFSIVKAFRALANPHSREAQEAAAFEFECSRAVASIIGKETNGFYIPTDVMSRSLDTTAGAGAITETSAGDFIEMIRNSLVLAQAGATFLTDLQGTLAIPKETSDSTAYWVAEGADVDESNGTVGNLVLNPSKVMALTTITDTMMKQTTYDVEAMVMRSIAAKIAQALEVAALAGTGAGAQPTGLLNIAGISEVAIDANGGALTWADVVALESAIADGVVGNMSYITNRKVSGVTKVTQKANGIGFIQENGLVNGYNMFVTNNIPSNLTKGAGTNLSGMLFGNFSDLIVGLWGPLEILTNPYSKQASGSVVISAKQHADIGVRNTQSFSRIVDIATA